MMQDHSINQTDKTLIKPTKPIVLIGMMGTGKTQLGRDVAKATSLPFFDTDQEIEAASGYTVSEYFARYGEDAFRDGEFKVMDRLLDGTPKIIAAGGGIIVLPQTRAILRERAITVWLTASARTLAKRCEGNNKRPLLQNGNPEEILSTLLEKRRPLYEETACFTVSTERVDHDALNAILKGVETCQPK
jgi:shikimate kinase